MTAEVISKRWWAPEQPGIGPDEFDLGLLEVGGDGPKDLGQAFLALHRVGAAACEAVATEPLADESTLAFALANARKLVAPEAAEIVAKSTGGDPNYGNLLLRDLLDDAEASALSLWRTCVAKGVPAPLVAKRIGLVYGVPSGRLLPFQKAASDIKSPEVALVDLADRALFTYCEQLVAEEAKDHKIEISKDVEDYNASEEGREHPKDAIGRWARVPRGRMRGGAAAQRIEYDEPEPEPDTGARARPGAPPAEVPPVPKRAIQRKTAKRPLRRPTRAEQIQATRSSTRGATRSATRQALRESTRPYRDFDEIPPNPHLDPIKGVPIDDRSALLDDDLIAPLPSSREYARPAPMEGLSVVLPTSELGTFFNAAPMGERTRVFRAGHLQRYAGDPEVYKDDDGFVTREHDSAVRVQADLVKASEGHRGQSFDTDRLPANLAQDAEILDNAKREFLRNKYGMSETQIERELAYVDDAPDFEDPSTAVLFYQPPKPGVSRDAPMITELIVEGDELLGHQDAPDESRPQWRFEPNQPLRFLGVTADRNRTFWDDNLKVVRNWRYAEPTSEIDVKEARKKRGETVIPPPPIHTPRVRRDPFKKAMSPERFHALEAQGRVHRDASGEFAAEEPAEEVAPVAPPVPKKAKQRLKAKQPLRQPQLVAEPTGNRITTRGSTRNATRNAERDDVRPVLPDDPDIITFAEDQHTVAPRGVHLGFGFTRKSPDERARREIERASEAFGDETAKHVHSVTLDKHFHRGGREDPIWHASELPVEDMEQVAGAIYEEMQKDQNFTFSAVQLRRSNTGGHHEVDVTISRNQRPLGAIDVIRWGDARKQYPYELHPELQGRFQTVRSIRKMLIDGFAAAVDPENKRGTKKVEIANPWIRVWKADNT